MVARIDKLYITQSEWSTVYGGRNAGKRRTEGAAAFKALPHDCCALTLAPFEDPVCTPRGTVFDRPHIIPYLAAHGNVSPVDGSPLAPEELLRIRFARSSDDTGGGSGYQCPVTLKRLTDHSHIVVNRGTGQVYSREGIERLRDPREEGLFRDFFTDQPFALRDLLTIQDPTNLAPRNVAHFLHLRPPVEGGPEAMASERSASTERLVDSSLALTSTACAPRIHSSAESESADEQQLRRMLSAVRRPAKVTVRTNLGDLHLELHAAKAPRTVFNFLALARDGRYVGQAFHRLIPGFVIQGGPSSSSSGGGAVQGPPPTAPASASAASTSTTAGALEFAPGLSHDSRGVVAMASKRGSTPQFYITLAPAKHLDRLYPIFGRVIGGWESLTAMEAVPVDEQARPRRPIAIQDVIVVTDPFEEYRIQERRRLDTKAERAATDPTLLLRRARAAINTPTTIGRYLRR